MCGENWLIIGCNKWELFDTEMEGNYMNLTETDHLYCFVCCLKFVWEEAVLSDLEKKGIPCHWMLCTLVHCATGKIGANIMEGKRDKKT